MLEIEIECAIRHAVHRHIKAKNKYTKRYYKNRIIISNTLVCKQFTRIGNI